MPDMSSSFLSAFLFAFPVLQLWSCFPSLVDWTFQVFGQLEYFNQRDELLFGELVIINAKGSEERTDLLFLGTALKFIASCNCPCTVAARETSSAVMVSGRCCSRMSRRIPFRSSAIKLPKYSSSLICATSSVRRCRSFS